MGKLKIIIPGNKYIEFGKNNLLFPSGNKIKKIKKITSFIPERE